MTFIIMSLGIMKFSIIVKNATLSRRTFSIMSLSIMTSSIIVNKMRHSA
jgi:hypothetical protein